MLVRDIKRARGTFEGRIPLQRCIAPEAKPAAVRVFIVAGSKHHDLDRRARRSIFRPRCDVPVKNRACIRPTVYVIAEGDEHIGRSDAGKVNESSQGGEATVDVTDGVLVGH